VTREQCVVDQLHLLAGAARTDVQDGIAVAAQHRSQSCNDVIGASDEQGDPAGRDVVRAAADRRIDDIDSVGTCGDGLDRFWARGRVHNQRRTRRHGRQQRAVQADLPHLFVGEYAEHHDIGLRPGLGHLADRANAQLLEVAALIGGSAHGADLMPGRYQAGRHGPAHPPRADEPDFHRGCSIKVSAASAASSTAPPWAAAWSARSTTRRLLNNPRGGEAVERCCSG
jgi:hypothetical protein